MRYSVPELVYHAPRRAAKILFGADSISFSGRSNARDVQLAAGARKHFITYRLGTGGVEVNVLIADVSGEPDALNIALVVPHLPFFQPGRAVQLDGAIVQGWQKRIHARTVKQKSGGLIQANFVIDIQQPLPWLLFRIENSDVKSVLIKNITLLKKTNELLPTLCADLLQIPDLKLAKSILYADIDPNVIDGSSVWLSSMASILCAHGPSILVVKKSVQTDVIIGNVANRKNLIVLSPADLGHESDALSVDDAILQVRALDHLCPNVQVVVVRGTDAAVQLAATRQFKYRANVYLTDFYEICDGAISVSNDRALAVRTIARQAARLLVQTQQIAHAIIETAEFKLPVLELPPPVPTAILRSGRQRNRKEPTFKIGYAGKIAPHWGIVELLDWVQELRLKGYTIELTIIGNKISGLPTPAQRRHFRNTILNRIKELGVIHHDGMQRKQALEILASMDFVWCYRPAELEDATLELSTKLVEAVAHNFAAICYPNTINKNLLGTDYPYFIQAIDDFEALLKLEKIEIDPQLAQAVRSRHSISNLSARFADVFAPARRESPSLLVAGHDLKFIDAYVSYLKSRGYCVSVDHWGWGEHDDLSRSKQLMARSDVIFCEWGLANAVWYSHNLPIGKRLIVRVHLQEINARAQRFGDTLAAERVDLFIFVSARVRDIAIKQWGWPKHKTIVIPNYVLDDEYIIDRNLNGATIRLGMVGIVPQRKRFDRALSLLAILRSRGHDAILHIKGHRPEQLAFMHGASRKQELAYYRKQYKRIESDPLLSSAVVFDGHGNDVANWYRSIDVVVSPSDFESFHYALADGVLAGCLPLVWPWEEAASIYDAEWIVSDEDAASQRIEHFIALDEDAQNKLRLQNRDFLVQRYGRDLIFEQLTAAWKG